MVVVRAPLVTVTAGVTGTVALGTVTESGLVNEPVDTVGRDRMMGMVSERLPLLLDKELRLELELGEEALEMLVVLVVLVVLVLGLELGDEVLELLLLLDEEELLELELDEELLLELLVEVLVLKLKIGEVVVVLVEGRLRTLLDEVTGVGPLPVHTPLQATIWPLTH